MDAMSMRKPYKGERDILDLKDLTSKEPFGNFDQWFNIACKTPGILEANAMTLATATKDGRPSARMVLLKGYDKNGFRFFTNYGSRKAQELESNPYASLLFYWSNEYMSRQIRVEGRVEKLSEVESANYFHSRPKASQIGAWCSQQSSVIAGRKTLDDKKEALEKEYANKEELPTPDFWGGYLVKPEKFEFWQGQTNRLHDRIVFRKPEAGEEKSEFTDEGDDGWWVERLAP